MTLVSSSSNLDSLTLVIPLAGSKYLASETSLGDPFLIFLPFLSNI